MNVIVSHGLPFRLAHPRAERAIVGIVAFGAVAAGLLAYGEQPGGALNPTMIHVSSVTWSVGTTVLNPGPGFTARPGTPFTLVLRDTNCLLGCSLINLTTASVSPASFSVDRVLLPLIPPGETGNLTVTVQTPSGSYSGPLYVELG